MRSPRTLLKASKLYPKKQLGQNFLADPSAADMIVDRSGIEKNDVVLEIGAGLGALTVPLADVSRKVYAVEKDRQLVPLLKDMLKGKNISNVDILEESIQNINIDELSKNAEDPFVVMGNLPYNISSQVLVQLVHSRKYVKRAVLMFQKELAQRIISNPGCKDYGRLSVMLQYCSHIRSVANVKAHLFFPKPKVDSEVLGFDFNKAIPIPADNELFFFSVIKAAFGKRRKTLKNALSGSELQVDAAFVVKALGDADIDPVRRAETLSVEEFVRLSNTLGRIMPI